VSGRLQGHTALITGGSRGLGAAVARSMAAEGCAVAVVGRTEQQWDERLPGTIHETVDRIRWAGGTALAVAADLAEPDDVDRAADEARSALGPITILVNNAALTVPGRPSRRETSAGAPPRARPPAAPGFAAFPVSGYRRHLEIGLLAPLRLTQLLVPDMAAAGRGAVINISSEAAFRPGPGPYTRSVPATMLAYGGTKAALQHLTLTVAAEVVDNGVAINALLPSRPIRTPGLLALGVDPPGAAGEEDFAEAAIRLSLATPATCTGQVLYHEDVLHPDRPPRSWCGDG
jgi:7-alpha-hydroxysteroid dehydrogenase